MRRLSAWAFGVALLAGCEATSGDGAPSEAPILATSPASEMEEDDAVEPRGSVPAELELEEDFLPDPATLTGFGGGSRLASELNPACLGWVRRAPNHRLITKGHHERLRIFVNGGDRDTTLVVRKPDGTFLCSDDVDGRHPLVEFPTTPGLHEVWVGTYDRRASSPYVLGVSRRDNVGPRDVPPPVGAMPRLATEPPLGLPAEPLESNFAAVRLRPGFSPSPKVLHGTSGSSTSESVDASTLAPGCAGHITAQPDHLLYVEKVIPRLVIAVDSGLGDTTLVVRRPDGRFLCDDDAGPRKGGRVEGRFEAGTYRVWVGSHGAIDNHPYRLGLSEEKDYGRETL